MKSIPNIDFIKLAKLVKGQEKPVGKYGNLKNFLKERSGVDIDEATLDKKLRTFFEDMITEILKNPTSWDRTRNINFMELFNYLGGQDEEQEQPQQPQQGIQPMGKLANRELKVGDKVTWSWADKGVTGTITEFTDDSDCDIEPGYHASVKASDGTNYSVETDCIKKL